MSANTMETESSPKGAHLAVMETHELRTSHKRTQGAIVLIPQPSNDPRDPLVRPAILLPQLSPEEDSHYEKEPSN